MTSLNDVGREVERVIDDPGVRSECQQRDKEFQKFVADSSIVLLTGKETQYYRYTLQSLDEQVLGSPYQLTDKAMKELGNQSGTGPHVH